MGSPTLIPPDSSGWQSPVVADTDSPKKIDLTDTNVKRSRLLVEKKKKQFE